MRSTDVLLLSLVVLAGCDSGHYCGVDLVYDRENGRCACPPDRVWDPDAGTCFAADGGCIERDFFRDGDGDGHGDSAEVLSACDAPTGYVREANDCDDTSAAANPGAPETCNEIDDDCDGDIDEDLARSYFRDLDGDHYGDAGDSTSACAAPAGYVEDATDCDDARSQTHPAALEICNELDDDCDGAIDEAVTRTFYRDADGDGHGDPLDELVACAAPSGYVDAASDCDDARTDAHPTAIELCNALDDDCSSGGGPDPTEDADGDGHSATDADCISGLPGTLPRDDCRDGDPTVHPDASFQPVPVCSVGRVPCYGMFRDDLLDPAEVGWFCIASGTACEGGVHYRPFAASWDWNCDGVAERSSPGTSCGPGAVGSCSGGGFVYDSGSPPECGSDVTYRTCAVLGGACLADESTTRPLSCR
jgi:hypothetical protein